MHACMHGAKEEQEAQLLNKRHHRRRGGVGTVIKEEFWGEV